jgi:nitrogen regulatory protein PII
MKKLEIIIPHERLENANDVLEKFGVGECLSIISMEEVKLNGNQSQLEEE